MVTPYPPIRDGIGAYAVQWVARLRAEGHEVEVLSPGPSAAHHHLDLQGWRGPLALLRRVRSYDKVIIQFHPDVFYPQPFDKWTWAAVSAGLTVVFRAARDLEVRVHETDYAAGRGEGVLARAARAMWAAAPHVSVHTEAERHVFSDAFDVPIDRIQVVDHGAYFVRSTSLDRGAARQGLGIPPGQFMFLSIGFIQPHKGFDRSIRGFAGLGPRGCRLDVVGSLRLEDPPTIAHREELEALAAHTPGATLHVGYVSDEEFDRWIVASDVVVLPYRWISSSGVLERAALYNRPTIVTSGALEAQAGSSAVVVADDAELARAMWRAAGYSPPPSGPTWNRGSDADYDTVMAGIRRRARQQHPWPDDGAASNGFSPAALATVFTPPHPVGRRSAVALKRVVQRLTNWQLTPVYRELQLLHEAVTELGKRRVTAPSPAGSDDLGERPLEVAKHGVSDDERHERNDGVVGKQLEVRGPVEHDHVPERDHDAGQRVQLE